MSPIIQVNHLCWSANKKNILNDISFSVYPGQLVGVIGVNGSGKTSLLRALYRINKPSSGAIFLNGSNIWQQSAIDVAKKIAVVSQSHTAMVYRVVDVVSMGLTPHKALFERDNHRDRQLIDETLALLDLTHLKQLPFETLSGGEQQRVLIARAIVQQGHHSDLSQHVLIMDEPTNHLDIHYQLDLLQRIKNLGMSVIISLHDLNMASEFCDYLLLMDRGSIVRQGSVEHVLSADIISRLYNVNVTMITHPIHQRPHLLFSYGNDND